MTSPSPTLLALDLGASNGRVVLGRLVEGRLAMTVVHRFEHGPVLGEAALCWDWEGIVGELRVGLARAGAMARAPVASLSCSSWAVDFGLLDHHGRLLAPPRCYRDAATAGMPASFADIITPDDLVRRTGALASPITTLCQLRALALDHPKRLQAAARLLHIADLAHHDLCGASVSDWTMATASGLCSLTTGDWDRDLLATLGIPTHFLGPIATLPATVGHIPAETTPHPTLAGVPVLAVAGHDTAAASLVGRAGDEALLSSGTWSMLGLITEAPLVTDTPARDGLETIGLAGDRWGLMCALMGLWPLQECRRAWAAAGERVDHAQLVAAATECDPATLSLVDPADPRFGVPCDMPAVIVARCQETGQRPPRTAGETAAVILHSLGLEHAHGVAALERATGRRVRSLRLVGGGSANRLLCQLTANATGLPVTAGPQEATTASNLALQAQALGLADDPAGLLEVSFPVIRYEPREGFPATLRDRFRELKARAARP
jgi:rhamnulokinase